MATQAFSEIEAAKALRDEASEIEGDELEGEEEIVTLLQTIADYVESTALPTPGRIVERHFFAEVAMAYVAGWEHATGTSAREAYRALRKVGLSI